jgi:hypothetical protein
MRYEGSANTALVPEVDVDAALVRKIQALMLEVYEAGRRDGGAAMRDAILKAAEVPALRSVDVQPSNAKRSEAGTRAPRGLLPQVLGQAMAGGQGMTEQQIIDAVAAIDQRVSPRSIGGQLRRFRDKVYRQEGRHWFLLEGKSAGVASAKPADLL